MNKSDKERAILVLEEAITTLKNEDNIEFLNISIYSPEEIYYEKHFKMTVPVKDTFINIHYKKKV